MNDVTVSKSIPKELLEALREVFPDRLPDIDIPDREVWARVGEQRVVAWIERVIEEQNESSVL